MADESTPEPVDSADGAVAGKRDYARLFTIGLMLILCSWGIKQLFLSTAIFGLGGALESETIELDQEAELAEETRDEMVEIAEEESSDEPDYAKMSSLQEEIGEKAMKIDKEYAVLKAEARADSASSASTALWFTRLFLRMKLLLDLFKIAGVVLVMFSSLGILRDDEAPEHFKWFAVSSGAIILLATLAWGFLSILS